VAYLKMQTVGKEIEKGQHIEIEINGKAYRLKCVACGDKKFCRSECHRWIYCYNCRAVSLDILDDIIDMEGVSWMIPGIKKV